MNPKYVKAAISRYSNTCRSLVSSLLFVFYFNFNRTFTYFLVNVIIRILVIYLLPVCLINKFVISVPPST